MKTKTHTLRGSLRGFTSLAASFAAFAGTVSALVVAAGLTLGAGAASAQSSVQVDTGVSGQTVQTGWTEWSIDGNNSGDSTDSNGDTNDVDDSALTVPTDLGNGGNVDLTLATDNGQNLDARDRSGASGAYSGSLSDVSDDLIFPDGSLNNDLILTLGDFKAGTFSMTVYVNDEKFTEGEEYSLTLDDANGTGQNVGTITDTQGSLDSATFDITSDGSSDMVLQMFLDGTNFPLNGFEIIPEPGSFALLGGLLALGSVMLRRRRG